MVDKSPIGYIPGKAYFLDKKPVKNPKYAHIGPTFKTGYHVDNIKILSDKHIVGRKGEMFKRIKPSTVANLMRREKNRENIYNLINNSYSTNTINKNVERETNTRGTVNRSEYSAYTLQSKVSKASGLTYATSQLSLDENTDYIIVDFRERDDYEQYHLQEAIHFPGPAIARDKFPPELYIKKNKPNTLIIVYHLDEKHGIPYAAGLFDKGFENVFLISGGIEAFMEEALDLVRGKKVPTLAKRDNTRSNILYKRSKYTEYPDEGDVLIPPTHVIEENNNNNSFVSHSTATIKKTPSRRAQSIGRSYASRSKAL